MSTLVWADISLDALTHNAKCLKAAAPNSQLMAIIKADAYGHGACHIAKALANNIDMLAVARMDEALQLRAQGISRPVTILNGCFNTDDFQLCQQHNFLPVIYSQYGLEQALVLQTKKSMKIPLNLWLKIDTGMHRLGLSPEKARLAKTRISADKSLNIFGLMSHLANADDIEHTQNIRQLTLFKNTAKQLDIDNLSLANSAATLFNPSSHFHWLRPGISLYGVQATHNKNQSSIDDLQPVMTLKSRIIHIQHLPANEPIGYSGTFITKKASRIATVAIGYGDGYPRHAANGTPVLINDRLYPLAGRVSMDLITVDISEAMDEMAIGNEVTLWGQGLPIERIAKASNTIAYELLSKVTARVKRCYA